MSNHYDTIVIGLGGMGSATCAQLASRGQKVLGLEQFDLGHARGSSHGETRIIRAAYFEHPDYVPLMKRAYALWEELENRSKTSLLHRTGVLISGNTQSIIRRGVIESALIHGINIEELNHEAVAQRFPLFHFPADHAAVFEPDAGYLEVENCVLQSLQTAKKDGADLRVREKVTGWRSEPHSVEVKTNIDTYKANHLVITTGAWMGPLLRELGAELKVLRKRLAWFTAGDEFLWNRAMPCYLFDLPDGVFYGFPKINARGIKVAEHSGGELLNHADDLLELAASEGPARARSDLKRLQSFTRRCLPHVAAETPTAEATCMYEMSPDENFIIDHHPHHSNVSLAGGFSGHGFKFATVVGEALADLATRGTTDLPIGFLGLSRFSRRH